MGKMRTRVWGILLVFAMLLTMLPVTALADDTAATAEVAVDTAVVEGSATAPTVYAGTALPEAVDGVITLTEDVQLSTPVEITTDTTIDLAGHKLEYVGNDKVFINVKAGTLTIRDSVGGGSVEVTETEVTETSDNALRAVQVCADATFTLKGGTIRNNYLAHEATQVISNYGTVNMNGGAVEGVTGILNFAPKLGKNDWAEKKAVCNITDGEVRGIECDYYQGSEVADGEGWSYGVGIYGEGFIDGATVNNEAVEVNISGGKIYGAQGIATNASSGKFAGFTVNMTGGEVIGANYGDTVYDDTAMYLPAVGVTKISGGTVIGGQAIRICAGELDITGGTITGTMISDGKDLVAGGSGGTLGAVVVGKASSGYVGDIKVSISNGATIQNTATEDGIKPTIVVSDKNMAQTTNQNIVNASGTPVGTTTYSDSAITVDVADANIIGDVVKISNLTQNTVTSDGGNTSLEFDGTKIDGNVYNQSVTDLGITSSTVTGNVEVREDGTGDITVVSSTVGSVGESVIVVNSTVGEEEDVTKVPDGASVEAVIGTKTYETLAAAIANAQENDVITLVKDLTVSLDGVADNSAAYVINEDITLDGNGKTLTATATSKPADASKTKRHVILASDGAEVEIKNLTVDGNGYAKHGIQAYTAPDSEDQTKLTLDNVTSKNNMGYGVVVNASSIEATALYTSGNGWGGVNVDSKAATASFSMSSGKIAEEDSVIMESAESGTSAIDISGGEFRNVGAHPTNALGAQTIEITDGSFVGVKAGEGDVVQISGGTYTTEIPEEYCADGFVLVKNEDGTFGVEPEAVATKITLDKTSLTLVKGASETVTATVEPAEATNKDEIVWTTSNSDIATVEAGKITAVGYGTATITARIGEVYASCEVSVICGNEECEYYDDLDFSGGNPWYHVAVDFVTEQRIMQGIAEKTFAPEMELTRAQFAQILYNMEGKPQDYETDETFPDVHEKEDGEDVWYYDAVMWAASTGVVKGYENGCYYPDKDITRQEMVTMLHRYAEYKNTLTGDITEDLEAFPDSNDNSVWDKEAFAWAVQHGIVNGKDGKLAASDPARRCEIAKIVMVYMSLV